MYVKEVKNEYGATVYHVEDEGCIQEFWTKEQAQEYVDYVKSIYQHWSDTWIEEHITFTKDTIKQTR